MRAPPPTGHDPQPKRLALRTPQPRSSRSRSHSLWVVGAALVLLGSIVAAVTFGPADISAGDVFRTIGHHLHLTATAPERLVDATVWQLRLPRVLTAAAVGAGLAISGVVMQALTRNPLADPYLLGLSSGASLGASLILIVGVTALLPVAAFVGATAALVATLALATAAGRGKLAPARTLLAGLAVGQLASALTSLVIFLAARGDQYREILGWLLGSLAGSNWASVLVAGIAAVLIGTLLVLTGSLLDGFAFGDDAAASLGISVQKVRWALLIAVALLTGALVSQSGAIGFVGLILPHGVRFLTGAKHRLLLPLSALVGASFLVWADTIARTIVAPQELPVGIVTAAIGAPVFAALLWRERSVT